MIKLVRLDERLIHGQVAIKWSKHTGVDRILVIDDNAAANTIVQKSLLMAAPANIKVAIKSVDEGIKILQDPRMDNVKALVVISGPTDLLKLVENVKDVPLINIGNYGRVAPKRNDEPRKTYRSNLYAYEDEVEVFKKIIATGIRCEYQTTPEDTAELLQNIL